MNYRIKLTAIWLNVAFISRFYIHIHRTSFNNRVNEQKPSKVKGRVVAAGRSEVRARQRSKQAPIFHATSGFPESVKITGAMKTQIFISHSFGCREKITLIDVGMCEAATVYLPWISLVFMSIPSGKLTRNFHNLLLIHDVAFSVNYHYRVKLFTQCYSVGLLSAYPRDNLKKILLLLLVNLIQLFAMLRRLCRNDEQGKDRLIPRGIMLDECSDFSH
ncbi:hypothetical protein KQX54_020956 [Cotesia glomerata]|uniref:Uncharacterized protein n=1 Tax=Cotesia glomerata TaxID=32391 RepID=A0AAV7J821_COTGL|nr:hypothetical protein KQX54_020956 [Cotesia glomerata]